MKAGPTMPLKEVAVLPDEACSKVDIPPESPCPSYAAGTSHDEMEFERFSTMLGKFQSHL